jgi:hypothetical protein
MKEGKVFVEDELNLAEETTIQRLAACLEPSIGSSVLIPGIRDSVRLNDKFMFIACQNDVRTVGRKALPQNIAKRLRVFVYPRPEFNDLVANCKEIAISELRSSHHRLQMDPIIAEQIAAFVDQLNKKELPSVALWSMRDVRWLFGRLGTMQLNELDYQNMTVAHHIIYFIMGCMPLEFADSVLNPVLNLVKDCLKLGSGQVEGLEAPFRAKPDLKTDVNCVYVMKGAAGIRITPSLAHLLQMLVELPSIWNAIFYLILSHRKKSLLLADCSSFKTYLASQILQTPVLVLNQETTISQLVGSLILLSSQRVRDFYLEQFRRIAKSGRLAELKEMMEGQTCEEPTLAKVKVVAKPEAAKAADASDFGIEFNSDDEMGVDSN